MHSLCAVPWFCLLLVCRKLAALSCFWLLLSEARGTVGCLAASVAAVLIVDLAAVITNVSLIDGEILNI